MNHKAYWRYQFVRDWPLLLTLLAVEVLFSLIALLSSLTPTPSISSYAQTLFLLTLYPSFALSYLYPLWHKSKLWNRRSADLYLGLPINKKGLYLDDLFLGLAEMLALFTISYCFGLLFAPLSGAHLWIDPAAGGWGLAMGLLLIATGYGLSSGIVSCANNAFDASVFLVLFLLGEIVLTYELGTYLPSTCSSAYSYGSCTSRTDYAFAPYGFHHALLDHTYDTYGLYNDVAIPPWVIVIHILSGIISAILGYFLSRDWRAEKAQTPSKSWYGYPLFSALPLAFLVGLEFPYFFSDTNWSVPLALWAIGTLLYAVLNFIGERKIRFGWKNILFYLGGLSFGYLFAFLMWHYV
jgi:hypothetical protein